jgi:hypothetical protein
MEIIRALGKLALVMVEAAAGALKLTAAQDLQAVF